MATNKYTLKLQKMENHWAELPSYCTVMSLGLRRISMPSALVFVAMVTRAAHSTASFPVSCVRVVTSHITMERAEEASMGQHLRMKTSCTGTPDLALCPWPTVAPIQMAPSSLYVSLKQTGWMASMLCLAKLWMEQML